MYAYIGIIMFFFCISKTYIHVTQYFLINFHIKIVHPGNTSQYYYNYINTRRIE